MRCQILVAVLLTTVLLAPAPARTLDWLPAVRRGDPAPALGGGFYFTSHPTVLADGSVLFLGHTLAGDVGLFRWSAAQGTTLRISQAELESLLATDPPTFFVGDAGANPAGDVLLAIERTVREEDDCVDVPLAILVPAAGEPVSLARVGQTVVGDGVARTLYDFGSFERLVPSAQGRIAGPAWLVDLGCVAGDLDPSGGHGAFVVSNAAGGLELVAEQGQPLGADADGTTFFAGGSAQIDAAGVVVFVAALETAGVVDRWGLYRRAPGEPPVRLLATGDAAPGLAEEIVARPGAPAGNDEGTIAFPVELVADLPGDADRDQALFGAPAGEAPEPWVREGDPAPVGIDGAVFDSFAFLAPPHDLRLSNAGHLAFVTEVRSGATTRYALFVRDPAGVLEARAVEGVVPAGAPLDWIRFSIAGVGDDGSVLFLARAGVGDVLGTDQALFLSRPGALPELLVQTGATFQLVAGAPEEPVPALAPGDHHSLASVASVLGQPDRAALYVLPVAEPAAAAGPALAALALLAARRRAPRG